MEHRCNAFRDGSVGSLCNSILMGLISKCVLPLDTSSVAKGLPLISRHPSLYNQIFIEVITGLDRGLD